MEVLRIVGEKIYLCIKYCNRIFYIACCGLICLFVHCCSSFKKPRKASVKPASPYPTYASDTNRKFQGQGDDCNDFKRISNHNSNCAFGFGSIPGTESGIHEPSKSATIAITIARECSSLLDLPSEVSF